MNDRITDSRARLHAALVPLLPDGRVHRYVPAQVVSPCVWIERHTWSPRNEGRATVIIVTWTIYALTDADTDEGQAFTDSISAKLYDATLLNGFRPTSARHTSIDVGTGSPTTTALVVTVDDPVAAYGMCPPEPPTPQPITRALEEVPT